MSTSPCFETSTKFDGTDSLRLEINPTCFYLLPYHHLDLVKYESDKGGDIITLSLLNRTVRITGKNLRRLAIDIQRRSIESVKPLPDKYGALVADAAWIKTIEILEQKENSHD